MKLAIEPVGKPRMTQRDRWAKRPVVLRYFTYCDSLRSLVPSGYVVPDQLTLRFYISMPKSWSAKKRGLLEGKSHQQRPDIDNLAKAFLDALCEEDSYVSHLRLEKYWSTSGAIEVDEY
jgi:Holliday junction resolvase RusA-like endonuclease